MEGMSEDANGDAVSRGGIGCEQLVWRLRRRGDLGRGPLVAGQWLAGHVSPRVEAVTVRMVGAWVEPDSPARCAGPVTAVTFAPPPAKEKRRRCVWCGLVPEEVGGDNGACLHDGVWQSVFQLAGKNGLVSLHHAPSKVLGPLDSERETRR